MDFFLNWLVRYLFFQIPGTRLAAGILGIVIVLQVFTYLVMALGLYRMARRQQLRGAVLAWIPIAQLYIAGAIADEANGRQFYRWLLCTLAAVAVALGITAMALPAPVSVALGWTSFGVLIVLAVFFFKALYRIFALYAGHPVPLLVLSIIFFFMGPVFVFALRNRTPRPLDARRHLK